MCGLEIRRSCLCESSSSAARLVFPGSGGAPNEAFPAATIGVREVRAARIGVPHLDIATTGCSLLADSARAGPADLTGVAVLAGGVGTGAWRQLSFSSGPLLCSWSPAWACSALRRDVTPPGAAGSAVVDCMIAGAYEPLAPGIICGGTKELLACGGTKELLACTGPSASTARREVTPPGAPGSAGVDCMIAGTYEPLAPGIVCGGTKELLACGGTKELLVCIGPGAVCWAPERVGCSRHGALALAPQKELPRDKDRLTSAGAISAGAGTCCITGGGI